MAAHLSPKYVTQRYDDGGTAINYGEEFYTAAHIETVHGVRSSEMFERDKLVIVDNDSKAMRFAAISYCKECVLIVIYTE